MLFFNPSFCSLFIALLWFTMLNAHDATEIIREAYNLNQGATSQSTICITIVRPTWQRSLTVKTWAKGTRFSLVVITEPAKEKGQSFLKRDNEIWNWVPNIQKIIKLPPSMMSEGWMGSDYSNDDLLKESSILTDYEHSLLGIETYNGTECYKIKLLPISGNAIVWGYIVKWISKNNFYQLRSEYFDEDNALVKTETASEIKNFDNRMLPSRFEIIPANKNKQKTIVELKQAIFNQAIDDSFFSQQNMKRIR